MATVHQTAPQRKSNSKTFWTVVGVIIAATLVYILATGAWSTHSAANGADAEAQRTAVQPTTPNGEPAMPGAPTGDTPRP